MSGFAEKTTWRTKLKHTFEICMCILWFWATRREIWFPFLPVWIKERFEYTGVRIHFFFSLKVKWRSLTELYYNCVLNQWIYTSLINAYTCSHVLCVCVFSSLESSYKKIYINSENTLFSEQLNVVSLIRIYRVFSTFLCVLVCCVQHREKNLSFVVF